MAAALDRGDGHRNRHVGAESHARGNFPPAKPVSAWNEE